MSSYETRAFDRSEPGSGPTPLYEGASRDVSEGWRRNTPTNIDELQQALEDAAEAKLDD